MSGTTQIDFPILGMTCVRCADTLQEHHKAVPGVQGALVLVKGDTRRTSLWLSAGGRCSYTSGGKRRSPARRW
jgi:hypothetical protein